MSPAFYKGKLQGLFEIAKDAVRAYIQHLDQVCKDGPATVDIIQEISDLSTSLLLRCVLGEDLSKT